MRPVYLEMSGFGSYGETTKIAFDDLHSELFLVTGDTGAGKTTIFDAISFALFGDTSSASKETGTTELYSHYMKDNVTEPYVKFVFTAPQNGQERTFEVRRTPKWYRRTRLNTLKSERVKAALWRRDTDGEELLADKVPETNALLQDLVGLTKAEFAKISMLAQGEFMTLLKADNDEKQKMFRKLFGTEKFDAVRSALGERVAKGSTAVKEAWNAVKAPAARMQIPPDAPDAGEMQILCAELRDAAKPNPKDAEDAAAAFSALCAWQKDQAYAAGSAAQEARKAYEHAHDRYLSDQHLAADFDRLQKEEERLVFLEAQQKEMQNLAVRIENIRKAEIIEKACSLWKNAEETLRKRQEQLKTLLHVLPQYETALAEAAALHQETAARVEKETAALTKAGKAAQDALAVFAQLDPLRGQIAGLQKEMVQADKAHADLVKTAGKLEKQTEEEQHEQESLLPANAGLENCQRQLADTEKAQTALKELQQSEKKRTQTLAAYKKAASALEDARNLFAAHEKAYYDNQAGALASQLEEGMPCPVCGSVSHPAPHAPAAQNEKILTRAQLDDEAGHVRGLEKDREKKSEAASRADGEQQTLKKRFEAELAALQGVAETYQLPIGEDPRAFLAALHEAAARKAADFKKQTVRLAALTRSIKDHKQKLASLHTDTETARRQCETLRTALTSARARENTLSASVSFASAQQAQLQLKNSSRQLQALKEELQASAENERRQSDNVTASKTSVKDLQQKIIPEAEQHLCSCRADYEKTMQDNGLDEKTWGQFAAPEARINNRELKDRYDAYVSDLQSQQKYVKTLREKVGGSVRPDLEKSAACQEAAQLKMEQLQTAASEQAAAVRENTACLTELETALAAYRGPAAEKARLEQLYDRISGRASGAHVDLETFVQRLYMEEILQAANARFAQMTGGRLSLRLRGKDLGLGHSNNGLDLMVFSEETQQDRSVSTLSGGESFLAALALSLGLADIIEARSAAVQLDIMFIDEGFGSLDDNARRNAVRVLQKLTDGRKLIGIISHVSELRQEIDEKLIVTKDEKGSHARWEHA